MELGRRYGRLGHAGTDGVVQLCGGRPRAVLRRKGTNGIGNETAGVVKYFSGRLLWLLWCGQAVNYPPATGGGCRLSATLVTALNRRSEQQSQCLAALGACDDDNMEPTDSGMRCVRLLAAWQRMYTFQVPSTLAPRGFWATLELSGRFWR